MMKYICYFVPCMISMILDLVQLCVVLLEKLLQWIQFPLYIWHKNCSRKYYSDWIFDHCPNISSSMLSIKLEIVQLDQLQYIHHHHHHRHSSTLQWIGSGDPSQSFQLEKCLSCIKTAFTLNKVWDNDERLKLLSPRKEWH